MHNLLTRLHITAVSSVPPVDKEILKVEEIDFNIATNTRSHKTMEYDIVEGLPMASPHLVVRRGQPFDIMVYFNRAYNAKMDDLRLNFDIGMLIHAMYFLVYTA